MPTYQYSCTDCGEPLEVVQSFSDDSLTECPSCGGTLRKVYGSVGVVFKGSGFYRNDSRDSSSSTGTAPPKTAVADASTTSKSAGSDPATTSATGSSVTPAATTT